MPKLPPRTSISALVAIFTSTVLGQEAASPAERLRRPILTERLTPAGSTTLPEIVVTAEADRQTYRATAATSATRLEEPILDTPRSVQVVTQQLLEDRQIVDPQEAVQNISGVQRAGSFTGVGETFIVRGFAQQALYKDGFRAGATPTSSFFNSVGPTDVANLEQIEVLKGPSSILYGRGEPGGTVNYITRQPAFENRFSLQQQVGTYDFYRTQLNANWNAVPGRLAVRLDGAYESSESFIDQVEGERIFVAPSFKWQIGPDTTLTFRGEYAHDDRLQTTGIPYANGSILPGVRYEAFLGEPEVSPTLSETWRGLLTLDHRWNESHRTTLSAHGLTAQSDGGYFILFSFVGPAIDPITGDVARSLAVTDFHEDIFTTRLDHTWDWTIYEGAAPACTVTDKDGKSVTTPGGGGFPTVKNRLLISGEYEWQENESRRLLSGHAPINPYRPRYTGFAPQPLLPGLPTQFPEDSLSTGEAYSVLLLDRLSLGDTVHLSFGGRYERFEASSGYQYPIGIPFPSSDNDYSEETFSPSAGLVVKPARQVAVYASYAESTSPFQSIGAVTASGGSLDPEHARQYEAGVKVELFDGKVFTTIAAFQIEKTDVAGPDPNNPLFSVNAGEERSRGLEFDVAGEPLPGWRIQANYAYIDARVTDDPAGLNTGHRRYGVPEHSGGIFTTYEFQDGALKGFGFGGGMFLADRVEIDNANTGNLSGSAQTDLVAYYRRNNWRAQINVKNLFDNEFYYSEANNSKAHPAPARTILAALKYEF